MGSLIGKTYVISGMTIRVLSEEKGKYVAENVTTHEIVRFDRAFLEKAIKLGKAEEVSNNG